MTEPTPTTPAPRGRLWTAQDVAAYLTVPIARCTNGATSAPAPPPTASAATSATNPVPSKPGSTNVPPDVGCSRGVGLLACTFLGEVGRHTGLTMIAADEPSDVTTVAQAESPTGAGSSVATPAKGR
jgi:hypothetical protein